jgi:spermidine synthase
LVLLLPAIGGMAALSWEVIWQLKISLAFGVSATGAAITLATMMAGMTLGASAFGRRLERGDVQKPLKMYGMLEIAIGLCGLLLGSTFHALEQMDSAIYQLNPSLAPLAQLIGVVLIIFVPAACMGASIPVFGRISDEQKLPVSLLYGLNTLGAAAGTLLVAFLCIPALGLQGTAYVAALLNLVVGAVAIGLPAEGSASGTQEAAHGTETPGNDVLAVVFATGFVTFLLEVAWFRALRAAFETTTTGFAIMLAVVLLALGMSARFVPVLRARTAGVGLYVFMAGVSILVFTPLIERLDLLLMHAGGHNSPTTWFSLAFILVGPSVFLLGISLPWYLESGFSPSGLGRIYAVNTVGAVFGALGAAWLFLPVLGFVHTAWLAGFVMVGVSIAVFPSCRTPAAGVAAVVAVVVAVLGQSGIGTTRVPFSYAYGSHEVIAYSEGPDASTSVIAMDGGGRGLFIDGFAAAAFWPTAHYMAWMGVAGAVGRRSPGRAGDLLRDRPDDQRGSQGRHSRHHHRRHQPSRVRA